MSENDKETQTPRKFKNSIDVFKKSITINEHGCWISNIKPNPSSNYITVSYHGKHWFLHRLMYVEKFGDIPSHLQVGHICDIHYPKDSVENRKCCNPEHMKLMTAKENTAHIFESGRGEKIAIFKKGETSGENNVNSKLTWAIVRDLRNRPRKRGSNKDWAIEFGVSRDIISSVLNNKAWIEPTPEPQ
jgi:hypothetical protein